MIKGVLFDYDGVMTKSNDANTPPSDRLAHLLDKSPEDIYELFMSFWPDYLRGKITDEELWGLVEDQTDREIPFERRDIWSKWEQLQPLPEMTEFVATLRQQGYPVGLLTNVTPTTEQEVREGGGYKGFDFLVRSCKVGYAKPEPEIYEMAMRHFNSLTPNEVVFVDDRERFLVPARMLGMRAILATNSQQVIEDVHRSLAKS